MADSSLSREHSLALLQKLATDDDFRSRFEQKPATALAELGTSKDLIDTLPATSTAPMKLASPETFANALEYYKNGMAEVQLCLSAPQIGLSVGAQPNSSGPVSIPFAIS